MRRLLPSQRLCSSTSDYRVRFKPSLLFNQFVDNFRLADRSGVGTVVTTGREVCPTFCGCAFRESLFLGHGQRS